MLDYLSIVWSSLAARLTSSIEFGLTCEYVRERKKRGKASRKDIAAQQAAAAVANNSSNTEITQASPTSVNEGSPEEQHAPEQESKSVSSLKRRRSSVHAQRPPPPARSMSITSQQMGNANTQVPPVASIAQGTPLMNQDMGHVRARDRHNSVQIPMDTQSVGVGLPTPRMPATAAVVDRALSLGVGEFGTIDDYHRSVLRQSAAANGQHLLHGAASVLPNNMMHAGTMPSYGESPYGVPSPQNSNGAMGNFRMPGESPLSGGFLAGASPVGSSPGWPLLPSPSAALYPQLHSIASNQTLRYPVLKPLLPRISAIIPVNLACDLLELYFATSSSAFMQPASPYILGFLFRKRSFLRPVNPRPCSPALLASMLWVAAQTSEAPALTSPPSARGKICHQLLELTVSLLKPLIHSPSDGATIPGSNMVINGVALGGFGVATHAAHDEGGAPGASGALDDVATYINLATVVSASEYKAASLRWWNAAWSLARELKLGRELPPNPEPPVQAHSGQEDTDAEGEVEVDMGMSGQHHMHMRPQSNTLPGMAPPGTVAEEEREERRRIWWLLYTVDRHLALCYNRPLFLLDVECDGLLQPENDVVWQAGEYYPADNREPTYFRRRGPCFECTGHSIFGYFLPLMTILGEIVDLNHAKNHPRFGLRFRNGSDWDDQAHEISQQLEAYGRSLKDFGSRFIPPQPEQGETGALTDNNHHDQASPSVHSTSTAGNRMTEAMLQTKTVVAYGTHLMHTLHILLNGKWDPISLLDDNDLWISSQSFISATSHAVSAAEAISDILEYDPDLSFMPFFFGIYLLQGSFLLLLIADKLQGEASPSVVKACETIVRAHEVCVVTLNTEYQVSTSITLHYAGLVADVLVAQFPESDALRSEPGQRTRARGLWRTTAEKEGSAIFVQMVW